MAFPVGDPPLTAGRSACGTALLLPSTHDGAAWLRGPHADVRFFGKSSSPA